MGSEDIAAGKIKQAKGYANDVVGAATGNTSQQIKGKAQKIVGKGQEELGRLTTRQPHQGRHNKSEDHDQAEQPMEDQPQE